MGYTNFQNDLFLSYRRAANETRDQWVNQLHDALERRLRELVGEVTIWRDAPQILAGSDWRQEIKRAIDNAAIFLAVISRTYFDSDICLYELDEALAWSQNGSKELPRKIVPIFKQPPKRDQRLPEELERLNPHRFYVCTSKETEAFRELVPGRDKEDKEIDPTFWETFERLAQDLMVHLETLKGQAKRKSAGTVFLASVGPELHAEREKLRADLRQHGFVVVPEREYLWNSTSLERHIAADIEQADLCVHLVNQGPSVAPETSRRADLQLTAATSASSRQRKPPTLVWIQASTRPDRASQRLFARITEQLSNDGLEYSMGSFEDFKTQVYDALASVQQRRAGGGSGGVVVLAGDKVRALASQGTAANAGQHSRAEGSAA